MFDNPNSIMILETFDLLSKLQNLIEFTRRNNLLERSIAKNLEIMSEYLVKSFLKEAKDLWGETYSYEIGWIMCYWRWEVDYCISPLLIGSLKHVVRPEIEYFLNDLGYTGPTNVSYQDQYNYGEINIEHTGEQIFTLPILSVMSPDLWALLAHEVSHIYLNEIIKDKEKLNSLLENLGITGGPNYLVRWIEEVLCDISALKILGPNYLISFIFMNSLDGDIFSPISHVFIPMRGISSPNPINNTLINGRGPTHPSHATRIDIMVNLAGDWIKSSNLLKLISSVKSRVEVDYNYLEQYLESYPENEQNIFKELVNYENEIKENVKYLEEFVVEEIIKKRGLESILFRKEDHKLASKLAKIYLKEKIPIGVYINDEELKKVAEEINSGLIGTKIETILSKLEGTVMPIRVISNAFCIVKMNMFEKIGKMIKNSNEIVDTFNKYKKEVMIMNETFLKSIEICGVYRFFKGEKT